MELSKPGRRVFVQFDHDSPFASSGRFAERVLHEVLHGAGRFIRAPFAGLAQGINSGKGPPFAMPNASCMIPWACSIEMKTLPAWTLLRSPTNGRGKAICGV
jgi:hypothetical protein